MTSAAPDGPGLNGGSWYTYDDRTVPNSEPPQVIAGSPGTITPAEGASFPYDAGAGPTIDTTSGAISSSGTAVNARECTGGGEKTWGAGFGLDLQGMQPDGGSVPLNSCEAGVIFDTNPDPDSGEYTGIPLPFNAKAQGYTGFQFYGMTKMGTTQPVDVHVGDGRTILWAGECNVCQSTSIKCAKDAGIGGCPCNDDFVETVTFTSSWKHFTIKWTDSQVKGANACLKPAGWSNEVVDGIITVGTPDAGIDSTQLYNIHFQFNTSSGTALPTFDVMVAYLTWTTD
jgi:hypothetical protein